MRGKQTMVLTVEELEAIRDEAAQAATDRFTVEEMKEIRDQYELRLGEERERREDLEWRLRMALARLQDAASAADKLRAVQDSLRGILGEVAPPEQERKVSPPPPPASVRRVTPPSLPTPFRKSGKLALA